MAEGKRLRKRLWEEGTCPICKDYLTDPVTLDCGHNFCSACIDNCRRLSPVKSACPQCRVKVQRKKLKPNIQLANMVEIAQDMSNLLKHRGVLSMEEADQEFAKDQINRALEILRKDRENTLEFKTKSEKESQEFLKRMEADREKTRAAFRQLHKFLEEQEKHLLDQAEEVEKEIARRRDEYLSILSREIASLDSLIQEVEEKKQQQSVSDLLQNSGDILERCKKKKSCVNPVVFPATLMWRIHDFYDVAPFLEGIIKKFKDNLVAGLHLQEEDVILDPATAHPSLVLSEDFNSVWCDDDSQDLPYTPERFEVLPYVLGRKGFTTGRHFWEVAVGNEEEWTVGVARKSVKRTGEYDTIPEEGIWEMGLWDGDYRVPLPPDHPPVSVTQELKKIRVTVNCEGRRITFSNADTGTPLMVYVNASFRGGTLLPCFSVSEGGHLTLCPQTEDSQE